MKSLFISTGNNDRAADSPWRKKILASVTIGVLVFLMGFITACSDNGNAEIAVNEASAPADRSAQALEPIAQSNQDSEALLIFRPFIRFTNYKSVTSGENHSCVINGSPFFDTNHYVACWGNNFYGQLGIGSNMDKAKPTVVPGLGTIIEVKAGGNHTCALSFGYFGGDILCWGRNDSGQLGNGTFSYSSMTPVPVQNITGVYGLTLGRAHSCVVKTWGGVACWGDNSSGQLGDGTTTSSNVPVDVIGLNNVIALSAGDSHTCAITRDGVVTCWGEKTWGFGLSGGSEIHTTPTFTWGPTSATKLASGNGFTCGVTDIGTLECVVSRGNEVGGVQNSSFWSNITNINRIVAMDGKDRHLCALLSNGNVACQGYRYETIESDPTIVPNLANVAAISTGHEHSCAVRTNGSLACWGRNNFGQLGNGSYIDKLTP
jgi:alpha-tubulin suppressor-like RCC1 family protein